MITKFKIFENLNELPKVGDYVLLNTNKYSAKMWQDFIETHIGEIVKIEKEHGGTSNIYEIQFENVTREIQDYFFSRDNTKKLRIEEFKYWSSDKNGLEAILNSKKYNL